MGQVAFGVVRGHEDVAAAFERLVGVEQIKRAQTVEERRVVGRGHAVDLQVGAVGHFQPAVAVAQGKGAEPLPLRRREPCEARADTHHEAVARGHGPERAGAPAAHLWVRAVCHSAALSMPVAMSARMELRRLVQRPARCSSAKRACIAAWA